MGKLHKSHTSHSTSKYHTLHTHTDTIKYAIFLLLMFIGFTGLFTALRYNEQQTNAEPTPLSMSDQFAQQVAETGTYEAAVPACHDYVNADPGNTEMDCFIFTIDTTLDEGGGHNNPDATFSLPIRNSSATDWLIYATPSDQALDITNPNAIITENTALFAMGRHCVDDVFLSLFSCTDGNISFAAPGKYQIIILSLSNTPGWGDAFGFGDSDNASTDDLANRAKFVSIDTVIGESMYSRDGWGAGRGRFQDVFSAAVNAIGIPENLFAVISTTGTTGCGSMFHATFRRYAMNSTSATIPPGLFDAVDSGSCTSMAQMFTFTFSNFAPLSTTGTIPAGLFDHLDTSSAQNVSALFGNTFQLFAQPNSAATIPSGFFDHLDIGSAVNCSWTFAFTFSEYAMNSTSATIPPGLFDAVNTRSCTDMNNMFYATFRAHATNSTVGIVPVDLFGGINTAGAGAASTSNMFRDTFWNYATRTATFKVSGATVGTQTFVAPYATKNITSP